MSLFYNSAAKIRKFSETCKERGDKSLIFNNMDKKKIPIALACVEDDGDRYFFLIHNIY